MEWSESADSFITASMKAPVLKSPTGHVLDIAIVFARQNHCAFRNESTVVSIFEKGSPGAGAVCKRP